MELSHLNQVNFNELQLEKCDFLIASAGNQSRCLFLAEKLHQSVQRKILLTTGLADPKKNISKHIEQFEQLGFKNTPLSSDVLKDITKLMHELCDHPSHHINIIIDYSCMPKKWYAVFIDCLTRHSYIADRINLFLSYTPKVFEKNPGRHAIDYMGPILFNRDNLKDKKPVSMIAALDMFPNSIMEAVKKVKPQKLLAFIPYCSHDPEYSEKVLENNRSLLGKLDNNSIIKYEADRPEEINTLLTSYCLDERVASEVMILPQGPKTFSMMSMLLSVRYPDVKLWEIIMKDQKSDHDNGIPVANPIIVKVSFISDELD
jgi:hypothetical protein